MGNCSDLGETNESPTLGKLGPVSDLRILNTVWLKDYQGLFDYQSKEVKQQLLKVSSSCFLQQRENHKIYQEHNRSNMNQKYVCIDEAAEKSSLLNCKKGKFLQNCTNLHRELAVHPSKAFMACNQVSTSSCKSRLKQKYPLKQKDILKFGKQKIKVRQIVLPDLNQTTSFETSHLIKTNKKIYENINFHQNAQSYPTGKQQIVNQIVSIATQNQQTCRICLQPGQLDNPLICPCKCTGSVRYIHLQCLRTWLGKQLNLSKTKYCITIKWTPLHCQMCKTHYKYRIYLDNKKYYTVQIPKPAKPFIVLQIVKKSAQFSKIFHFVSLSQSSKLSIGRKKDIDIKLSEDISISRHHANLIYDYENRQFLIQDNKSKFGTLVLVKRNLIVSPKTRGISFQVGGQIFTFQTHRLQGSIPDYYDEQGYLNIVQKGSGEKVEEEQSDQNNDQEDDFDQQVEENLNISQNPTQAMVPNNHIEDNHSGQIHIHNQPRNQPQILLAQNQPPNIQENPRPQNRISQPLIQNLDI